MFLLLSAVFSLSFTACKIVKYPYYLSDDIFAVDLVFCVDISGSMGGQLAQVKSNLITLYEKMEELMLSEEKYVTELRAKVIVFSDIYVDGENGLQETRMYELPLEEEELSEYVQDIELLYGGDTPESGLEALGMAMQSSWKEDGINKRDVIFIWSDAPALPLRPESWPDFVPPVLYRSLETMTDAWENDERNIDGKRLILFTPEAEPWTTINNTWSNVFSYPHQAAGADVDFDTVLDVIVEDL